MKHKRKSLTKEQVDRYLSEVYMLLYLGPCQTRFKKKLRDDSKTELWGLCDPGAAKNGDDILWISSKATNYLINTVIHECLHAIYHDFSETKVEWLTSQICKKISAVQYAHLILALAINLKKHYRFRLLKKRG